MCNFYCCSNQTFRSPSLLKGMIQVKSVSLGTNTIICDASPYTVLPHLGAGTEQSSGGGMGWMLTETLN